jgi:hypothetical protein
MDRQTSANARRRMQDAGVWMIALLLSCGPAAGAATAVPPAAPAAAKEFTPQCVPSPLPVQPQGQVASREITLPAGAAMRIALWRYPCSGGDSQALLTFTPLRGSARVDRIRVRQAGREDRFPDLLSQTAPLTFLFGPIDAPVSALMSVNIAPPFDDDCAFSIDYLPLDGVPQSLSLAAEPAASCALDFGAAGATLSSRLAGTWADPARGGEAVMLDFLRIGELRVAFLSWYTYEGGQQRYLIGNGNYLASDRSVRVDIVQTGGADFGAAFLPAQVTRRPWGEATLEFASCTALSMTWRRADGVSGTLHLQRVAPADGVECP